MKITLFIPIGALAGGLVACLFLRWLAPQVALSEFTNVIGIAAVAGAALSAYLARRTGRFGATGKTENE